MKTETKELDFKVGKGVPGSTADKDGFYTSSKVELGPQTIDITKSSVALTGKTELVYKTSTKPALVKTNKLPLKVVLAEGEVLLTKVQGVTGTTPGETEDDPETDIIGDIDSTLDIKATYEVEVPPVYDPSKTVLTKLVTEVDLYKDQAFKFEVEFKYDDDTPYVLKTPPKLYNDKTILAAGVLNAPENTKYVLTYKPKEIGDLNLKITAEEIEYMSEELKVKTVDTTPLYDPEQTIVDVNPNPFDVFVDDVVTITVTTKLDNGEPYDPSDIAVKISGEIETVLEVVSTEAGVSVFKFKPIVGSYEVVASVDSQLGQPVKLEAITTEKPPINPEEHGFGGFNPLPHRNSVYRSMGYWVIDEIVAMEKAGKPWYEDQSECKYPKDVALIAYLLDTYENVEIQESRNGRILGRADFEFNH